MNRKERRAQKGKGKSNPVNVMAPNIPINTLLARQVDKVIDQQRSKASNDTLNLIVGILTIVLKELQGFDVERIEEILKQMMEQMELCGQHLVTTDEMVALAESYGIKTYIDEDSMSEIGRKIQRKIKVFELLDTGITEIEELSEKANITSREASAFRWEYNSKKYGVIDVTKQEKAFKFFDKGIFDVEHIAKKIESSKASVYQYKSNWKSQKSKAMSIDEFADVIIGNDSNKENDIQEEKAEDNVLYMDQVEVQAVEEVKESVQMIKKGFKSKKKTIELEGEFATYKIENKVVEFWGNAFEKEHLVELIEELKAVVEEF